MSVAKPNPASNKFVAKRLTNQGRALVQHLVWDGGNVTDAHERLGMSRSWCRALLSSPPVLAHMRAEMDVRRSGERPRNLHRLTQLRDQSDNLNAAVAAVKMLEHIDDEAPQRGRDVSPGFVVQVNVHQPQSVATIDAKPLIEQAPQVNGELNDDDSDVLYIDGRDESA